MAAAERRSRRSLHVLHVESGKHFYGGPLQVHYLVRGLARRGVRNTLVCPRGSGIARAAAESEAAVLEVPIAGDLDLRFVGRLLAILRRMRPDVLHLHGRRGADVLGGIAGRLAGVPVVLSRRVDNPESPLAARLKYRLFHRVVTISSGISAVLTREGVPAAKIRRVPDGVDTAVYRPERDRAWFEAEFALPPGAPTVGMVAQFIPRKGHDRLLDAVPTIRSAVPDARFLLFGTGPLWDDVRARVVREGLEPAVRLSGFREDLPRVLPCLDALAHPASMEGMGVAVLQASACGVPVVASAVGGLPEVVRDGATGFLIPQHDADLLAQRVSELLGRPDRARAWGAAGRRWIEAEFSADRMVEGNLAVYGELVPGPSGSSEAPERASAAGTGIS